MEDDSTDSYISRVRAIFLELGIPADLPDTRGLQLWREPERLVDVMSPGAAKPFQLGPEAAAAWTILQTAATDDGVELRLLSGFRGLDFQAQLIRRQLAQSRTLEVVLKILAPPGYSEHHSGCAVDIGTPGCPGLDEDFENTAAFAWLSEHAGRFGFTLSFPRGNRYGYIYEPWHWCYRMP